MQKPNSTNTHYTPIQLKLPLEIDRIIDISDPVYSFNEILDHIDLNEFLAAKECRTGRPRCDAVKLLKIVLFSFMENGYLSLRNIEKACKTDIRYMWLLDGMKTPSHVTFGNFIKNDLSESVEKVFQAVNNVIFEKEKVDTEHAYIDGTKIEANANKYTWVWKKACIRSRDKVFGKITDLLNRINTEETAVGMSWPVCVRKRRQKASVIKVKPPHKQRSRPPRCLKPGDLLLFGDYFNSPPRSPCQHE